MISLYYGHFMDFELILTQIAQICLLTHKKKLKLKEKQNKIIALL